MTPTQRFPGRPTSPAASDDEPKVSVPATPVVKVKAEAAKVKATPASARGAKRKSMHDFVEDLAAQDRSQRLKSNLEMARLQHQEREANRQREHELMMLDRQFQLGHCVVGLLYHRLQLCLRQELLPTVHPPGECH
ncbi:hypothetical protein B0H14DRAFT_3458382 [Mycena olivaceomarginata]|nr:hypothetical protein B0H14DRAFT_3458382 [Mycena olivaceomarginata]